MKVKVRNQLYHMRNRYAYPILEFNIYEGEQVPNPKWVLPGTICLATGDPNWPIRILDADSIVSVDANAVDTDSKTMSVANNRVFQIAGSKGASYTVTITSKDRTCTCPGFSFRGACKHINNVLEAA